MTTLNFAYLMDGAQIQSLPDLQALVKEWLAHGWAIDLYADLPKELHGLGPILCQPDEAQTERLLGMLQKDAATHSVSLLLLAQGQTLETCAIAFQRSVRTIECMDGMRFYLRFADARIFSVLPRVMNQSQWNAFSATWTHWKYVGRDGQPQIIQASDIQCAQAHEERKWSDEQIHLLTDLGWPDNLVHEVRQIDQQWLMAAGPAAQHALACEVFKQAQAEGKADDLAWQIQSCIHKAARKAL